MGEDGGSNGWTSVPEIGTEAWDRQLASLGLDRSRVDDVLRYGLAAAPDEPTAHDLHLVGLGESERVQLASEAAAWVLFHEQTPGYATFIYWRMVLSRAHADGHNELVDWMVRQIAAMLQHGRPAVVEAVDYALGVDFFEAPHHAQVVVPRLVGHMGPRWRAEFLSRSSYIDWEAKRAFYLEYATDPVHHPAVARAIEASLCAGFFGTVDGPEALELLSELTLEPELADRIRERLTTPIRAWIEAAVAMTRPMQRGEDHALLLAFEPVLMTPKPRVYHGLPGWFLGSELWSQEQRYGRIVSTRHSLDAEDSKVDADRKGEERRALDYAPPSYDSSMEWHLLRSEPDAELLPLVGTEVELRPRGATSRTWRRLRKQARRAGIGPTDPG